MQQVTPDQMRGRMASQHIAVVTSGPRLSRYQRPAALTAST